MNAYDFDETIYRGDSMIDFSLFCIRRHPLLLRWAPYQLWGVLMYLLGIWKKERMKEHMYAFLRGVPDLDGEIELFWQTHFDNIKPWYLEQKRADDILISASPEFLLRPAAQRLGVRLIASRVNARTGRYDGGFNCHGAQKVVRLEEAFPAVAIDCFYSDSTSDTPMALRAAQAFRVRGDERTPWNEYQPTTVERLKGMFFSRDFFMFLVIGLINTINGIWLAAVYALLLQENLAFVAGYLTSLLISYVLNSLLTFRQRLSWGRLARFALSYAPNFFIQNLVVLLVFNVMGLHELVAYALAAVIGVPVTFVLMKVFAFAKKRNR